MMLVIYAVAVAVISLISGVLFTHVVQWMRNLYSLHNAAIDIAMTLKSIERSLASDREECWAKLRAEADSAVGKAKPVATDWHDGTGWAPVQPIDGEPKVFFWGTVVTEKPRVTGEITGIEGVD